MKMSPPVSFASSTPSSSVVPSRAFIPVAVLGALLATAPAGWAAEHEVPGAGVHALQDMPVQGLALQGAVLQGNGLQAAQSPDSAVYMAETIHVAGAFPEAGQPDQAQKTGKTPLARSGAARPGTASSHKSRGTRKILLARVDPSGQTHPFGRAGRAGEPGTARALSHRHSLPVWELGLGASAITLPDYRGSDRQRQYLLPLPIFVYRAPHLRVDRGGIRADLWDSDRYELDVSVGATPPVRRTTSGIRAGMPRLKPLFEIGPRLQVHLWSDARTRQQLRLELPLRYAMPFGRSQNRGWVFSPNLTWQVDDVAGLSGWRLALWGGPVFSTRAWHRYYYQVEPQYARPGRPAYAPKGGYSGLDVTASINRRYPQAWVAGFVRASHLGGAAIADSPLVRRRANVSAGLVVGWLFARSQEEVRQAE